MRLYWVNSNISTLDSHCRCYTGSFNVRHYRLARRDCYESNSSLGHLLSPPRSLTDKRGSIGVILPVLLISVACLRPPQTMQSLIRIIAPRRPRATCVASLAATGRVRTLALGFLSRSYMCRNCCMRSPSAGMRYENIGFDTSPLFCRGPVCRTP